MTDDEARWREWQRTDPAGRPGLLRSAVTCSLVIVANWALDLSFAAMRLARRLDPSPWGPDDLRARLERLP